MAHLKWYKHHRAVACVIYKFQNINNPSSHLKKSISNINKRSGKQKEKKQNKQTYNKCMVITFVDGLHTGGTSLQCFPPLQEHHKRSPHTVKD